MTNANNLFFVVVKTCAPEYWDEHKFGKVFADTHKIDKTDPKHKAFLKLRKFFKKNAGAEVAFTGKGIVTHFSPTGDAGDVLNLVRAKLTWRERGISARWRFPWVQDDLMRDYHIGIDGDAVAYTPKEKRTNS